MKTTLYFFFAILMVMACNKSNGIEFSDLAVPRNSTAFKIVFKNGSAKDSIYGIAFETSVINDSIFELLVTDEAGSIKSSIAQEAIISDAYFNLYWAFGQHQGQFTQIYLSTIRAIDEGLAFKVNGGNDITIADHIIGEEAEGL